MSLPSDPASSPDPSEHFDPDASPDDEAALPGGVSTSSSLLELFTLQTRLLQQIEAIGQHQLQLIDENDMTGLMRLLSDKNPLVNQLQQIGRLIRELTQGTTNYDFPGGRDTIVKMKADCDLRSQRILEMEKHCESKLVESRNKISTKMEDLQSGSAAAGAYQSVDNNLPTDSPGTSSSGGIDFSCG